MPGPRRPQPPKRELVRPQRVVAMQSVSAADPASAASGCLSVFSFANMCFFFLQFEQHVGKAETNRQPVHAF